MHRNRLETRECSGSDRSNRTSQKKWPSSPWYPKLPRRHPTCDEASGNDPSARPTDTHGGSPNGWKVGGSSASGRLTIDTSKYAMKSHSTRYFQLGVSRHDAELVV